jgi:hypothetical protein
MAKTHDVGWSAQPALGSDQAAKTDGKQRAVDLTMLAGSSLHYPEGGLKCGPGDG